MSRFTDTGDLIVLDVVREILSREGLATPARIVRHDVKLRERVGGEGELT